MLRGTCAVIFHADGGDEFGLDAVTPVPYTLGVVVAQSRDGTAIRAVEDAHGRRHRAGRYTYRLPGMYGCALLAATRDHVDTVSTVDGMRRLVRAVIHQPVYRATVIVVRNLDEQITAFAQVAATMRQTLDSLPADERAEVEQASRILRKARAARGQTQLPVITLSPRRQP